MHILFSPYHSKEHSLKWQFQGSRDYIIFISQIQKYGIQLPSKSHILPIAESMKNGRLVILCFLPFPERKGIAIKKKKPTNSIYGML